MRGTLTIEDPAGSTVEWKPGEHITVEVIDQGGNHVYGVETRETVPPDIRERHHAEMEQLKAQNDELERRTLADAS